MENKFLYKTVFLIKYGEMSEKGNVLIMKKVNPVIIQKEGSFSNIKSGASLKILI